MFERAIKLPPAMSAFNGVREAPRALVEQIIEELVRTLDTADGDPDLEDGGDDEYTGDEADTSFPEWDTRGRHKVTAAGFEMHATRDHEDAEDDDPAEEDDFGEDGHDRELTNEDGDAAYGCRPGVYATDQSLGPIDGRGRHPNGFAIV